MDTYKLVSTAVNRDVNVKDSSDAGKRKVSEAVIPKRASPVRKHSQQFSPGTKLLATKSLRKNLFVVDENEHARERAVANRQQSNLSNSCLIACEFVKVKGCIKNNKYTCFLSSSNIIRQENKQVLSMNKFTVKNIILWNHAKIPRGGSYLFIEQDNIETKRYKLYRQVRQN